MAAKVTDPAGAAAGKRRVRTFTATRQDLEMLETVARYHGFSKSGTITSLIRREFWRLFPAGTRGIRPERGARVLGRGYGG
ncbi:MAG TPA: hypothetical protein VFD06_09315 [Candidatus Polarisedimenticolia bacterium]|nr:hypothetical protein [Candidatus Polarisedimenticolia bacterium]